MSSEKTAARRLVETLVVNGVDHVFCVPGESYLAVLDALGDVADRIRVLACRHEAGAANMAEAYGKLTGRPGVCMVTRGPGATHASVGVHTAEQDSTPFFLFVGQVAGSDKGRGAFQEVDYARAFGPLSKWAAELDEPSRTAEMVSRGFAVAANPGQLRAHHRLRRHQDPALRVRKIRPGRSHAQQPDVERRRSHGHRPDVQGSPAEGHPQHGGEAFRVRAGQER